MSFDKTKVDELFKTLDKDSSVALLVQLNPDPDCLGAAAGFGLILQEHYDLKYKIFHLGELSHPQNKSMVNVLHLKLSKGESFKRDDFALTVVLDTDLTGTGFATDDFVCSDIRIDHHSMDRDVEATFEDVRQVGATCSIVCNWLKEYGISLKNHSDVATALILGIKTDTAEFSSDTTTDLDFEAFRDVMPYVDRESLSKLSVYPLPESLFDREAKALDSKVTKASVLVSSIGTIVPQKRDFIPIIADRFIRMDSIHTVVIMGIVEKHLVASVRSTDTRVGVATLCEEVFGENFSGAKKGCGGAKVPLASVVPIEGMELSVEARAVMESEIFRYYSEKIFSTLGE